MTTQMIRIRRTFRIYKTFTWPQLLQTQLQWLEDDLIFYLASLQELRVPGLQRIGKHCFQKNVNWSRPKIEKNWKEKEAIKRKIMLDLQKFTHSMRPRLEIIL